MPTEEHELPKQSNSSDGAFGSVEKEVRPASKETSYRSSGSSSWWHRVPFFDPYIWGLVVLLLIGSIVAWHAQKNSDDTLNISGESTNATLNQEDFAQLAQEQAEIDKTNKKLNIRANSIFNGSMLVKSSLDVQGQLRVGQEMTLNDLAIAGQGTVNNLEIQQDLNVEGETRLNGSALIQESLSVNQDITVAGSGTFADTLTARSIEAGDLRFNGILRTNGHIVTGGPQTGANRGQAVGSGGTVSVNGNDTAGTVTINTGGSPSAGILVSVQFGSPYTAIPRVNVTPVGVAAGAVDWYITRTRTGFKIGASNPPPAGSSFSFDYFIAE